MGTTSPSIDRILRCSSWVKPFGSYWPFSTFGTQRQACPFGKGYRTRSDSYVSVSPYPASYRRSSVIRWYRSSWSRHVRYFLVPGSNPSFTHLA